MHGLLPHRLSKNCSMAIIPTSLWLSYRLLYGTHTDFSMTPLPSSLWHSYRLLYDTPTEFCSLSHGRRTQARAYIGEDGAEPCPAAMRPVAWRRENTCRGYRGGN